MPRRLVLAHRRSGDRPAQARAIRSVTTGQAEYVANRAMLLALDSADPPAGHDGMYPRGALLAANYSVPILWLSLFDTDGLVTWPGIHGSAFAAVAQPHK